MVPPVGISLSLGFGDIKRNIGCQKLVSAASATMRGFGTIRCRGLQEGAK